MHLDGIGFRYRRNSPWILDNVSAVAAPGMVCVLEGRNGVGKSTLLQIIVGVLRPSRGRVIHRPVRVAWVPERFPADQAFTIRQYLNGVAGLRGLTGSARAVAVDGWTERLGIGGFLDTRLPDLSKGTAQKVGLAQALLVSPQLLVLDEPWEGLDAAARELVPTLVAEVIADGGAVIASDHRGEAGWLPGATIWRLSEAGLTAEAPPDDEMCTVEVAVSAAEAPAAVALLRSAGHERVRVRAMSGR